MGNATREPRRLTKGVIMTKAKIKQDKRRVTNNKSSSKRYKGTIDPKWLTRGNISNYNSSDVISNGS